VELHHSAVVRFHVIVNRLLTPTKKVLKTRCEVGTHLVNRSRTQAWTYLPRMQPRITILINSYDRIEFLDDAVRSVLSQENLRSAEVVLVAKASNATRLEHLVVNARSKGVPFRIVAVPDVPIGAALAAGITEARGEIIAFLDDDDMWERQKLSMVQDAFDSDGELGLFHNGQTFVNGADRELPWWNPHRLVRHPSSRKPPGHLVKSKPGSDMRWNELLSFEPMFNNSSISICKHILHGRFELLRQITGGEDSFLFFAALASGMTMYSTSERLTRVRIHPGSSTASSKERSGFEDRVSNYLAFVSKHMVRIRLCEGLFEGGPTVSGEAMLARDRARWRLVQSGVGRTPISRASIQADIKTLLKDDSLPYDTRDLLAICVGVGGAVARPLTRAAFMAWRLAW